MEALSYDREASSTAGSNFRDNYNAYDNDNYNTVVSSSSNHRRSNSPARGSHNMRSMSPKRITNTSSNVKSPMAYDSSDSRDF